jgi:hypothetical protein
VAGRGLPWLWLRPAGRGCGRPGLGCGWPVGRCCGWLRPAGCGCVRAMDVDKMVLLLYSPSRVLLVGRYLGGGVGG